MTRALLAAALVPCLALAAPPRMKPGVYPEKEEAWKKLSILDVSIGMDFDKVPGFTCGPDPVSQGFTSYRHTCVKFLDAKCKGRPSKIFHIRASGDLPKGQSCFMDEGAGSTYLDRKSTTAPLSSISIVATDTSAPRVYEINYTFAKDVLTDDSNLGKALIAKFGKPSSRNDPIQWSWTIGDTTLTAGCGTTEGPTGDYCKLSVSDTVLLDAERSLQQAFDDEQKVKAGPPAPKL